MNEQEARALYQEFSPQIQKYLYSKLPAVDVQEVLNDVFFDAIDDILSLKKEKKLKNWLYKIARNNIVDYYRKKKIKSFLLSQIPYVELFAKEMNQPEFIMEKNQLRDKIESAMRAISQKYQQILRMHYEDQMPIKQIALSLNLTPKATESLLYRARQQFMKAYERK